jgi:hypothetical protein
MKRYWADKPRLKAQAHQGSASLAEVLGLVAEQCAPRLVTFTPCHFGRFQGFLEFFTS